MYYVGLQAFAVYIIVIVVVIVLGLPHILFLSPPTLPGHGMVRARLAPGPRYAKRIHRARSEMSCRSSTCNPMAL